MISDEREWSDEQNIMQNDGTVHTEIGYDDVPIAYHADSKRSRQMAYEQAHGWEDGYHPHRD